jgi:hypothetical protein
MGNVEKRRGARYKSVFPGLTRTHLFMPVSFFALIEQACQQRDVNRSTYMRRAIALTLAHDLNLPIHDVLSNSPAPGPYRSKQFNRGQSDDGADIESWCPHPGCQGEHLR